MLIGSVPTLVLAVVIIVVMATRTLLKRRRHAGNRAVVLDHLTANVICASAKEVVFLYRLFKFKFKFKSV